MAIRRFLWDDVDDCVLAETDETGAVLVTYTREPGAFGPLLNENRGGTKSYYHFDALGSTTMLTDDTGAVTDTFQHDAWGNQVSRTGTTPTPYTWVGRWGYQDDSGTAGGYYIRARTYQPAVARWISVDPVWLNQFSETPYSHLKVVASPDPSGERPIDLGQGIIVESDDHKDCQVALKTVALLTATIAPCFSTLLTQFIFKTKGHDPCPGVCKTLLESDSGFLSLFDKIIKSFIPDLQCSARTKKRLNVSGSYSFEAPPGFFQFNTVANLLAGLAPAYSNQLDLFAAFHAVSYKGEASFDITCGDIVPSSHSCCCQCNGGGGVDLRVTDTFDFCGTIPPVGNPFRDLAICGCLGQKLGWGTPYTIACPLSKATNIGPLLHCKDKIIV